MPREVRLAPTAPVVPCAVPPLSAPANWVLLGPPCDADPEWHAAEQALLGAFRGAWPQARLFTMDWPGTASRLGESCPRQVQALCVGLRRRLSEAGVIGAGHPVGLIGHGLGVAVATEWARVAPHEVGALVLISPALRPFTPMLRSLSGRRWLEAWRVAWREPGGVARGWARWRYVGSRRRPSSRVLLLAGKADAWRDWRSAQPISRAWGAALRLHPQAGHDLLRDDPAWVAEAVLDWLRPVGRSLG